MTAKLATGTADTRAVITGLIDDALKGRTLSFKESFDRVLRSRVNTLVKEEKLRVANFVFGDHSPKPIKEADEREMGPTYDTVYVIDPQLFTKEKSHMPDWMQKASPNGTKVEPVKEKDAIELTKKFNSIEISDA